MLSMPLVVSSVQSNTLFFPHEKWSKWICKLHSGCRPSTAPPVRHLQCSHSSLLPLCPCPVTLLWVVISIYFHFIRLFQLCVCANTTSVTAAHEGPGIETTEKTEANLWPGSLRPSCLASLVTQDIKARWFCRSQLWVDRGQRWCMCPTT